MTAFNLRAVQVHLIESFDDAAEFKRWLGTVTGPLGVDIETTGLNPWGQGAQIRLIQFGDAQTGWAMPWQEWRGLALEVLNRWEGEFVCHNLAFESRWFHVHGDGYRFPVDRTHDTMIAARIIDPLNSAALKTLATKHLDKRAAYGQEALATMMTKHKWGWDTVPINLPEYWMYGSLDPVITRGIHDKFSSFVSGGGAFAKPYDLEMAVRHIATSMELRGLRVDPVYAQEQFTRLDNRQDELIEWGKETYGINIASTKQLGKIIQDLGGEIREWTDGGNPKTRKEDLKYWANTGSPELAHLAKSVVEMRESDKIAESYFASVLRTMDSNHVVHPEISTVGARTGRMCLPDTHLLLTEHGPTPINDVRVGDRTLDEDGSWTRVTAIHRYSDQPTLVWEGVNVQLEATAEHRWVSWTERGKRHLEPFHSKGRRILQLTPGRDPLDLTSLSLDFTTEGEVFAALIGLLVTDGRVTDRAGIQEGLRAYIYQTEKKFYGQIKRLLPEEAVMYDRLTKNGEGHHEIRLSAKWLRSRLENAQLRCGESTLKESKDLVRWVLSLSEREVRAFLTAAWLADGTTAHPNNKTIHCGSANLREVLRIAAYRCGYRSKILTAAPSPWSTKPRMAVKMLRDAVNTHHLETTFSRSDVWCVSTEAGTFTAWSSSVGPYLTGNSVSNPPLQQLPSGDPLVRKMFIPREGNLIVSCDYNQVELRLMAHFSSDPALIDAFVTADSTGGDFFTALGSQIYGDPAFSKKDPRRGLVKNVMYGKLYGAGVAKMAESAGVPVEQMQVVAEAINETYPGIEETARKIISLGDERLQYEGQGYVMTPFGRRLPCDSDRTYALTNYLIQGHAAEVLKTAIVNLDAAGLGDYMLLPVHDEILFDVPANLALEVKEEVGNVMSNTRDYAVAVSADAEGPFTSWGEKYEKN